MINTRLKENVEIISGRKLKDGAEKRILANRQILAYILKGTLSEYRDIPLKEIEEKCLEDPIEISGENVLELKQEMIQNNDHKTNFDLHFIARRNEEVIKVNLEIQDRINPGYPLVKRGLVYCGVMLANQLGSVITNSR